jgi:hypothetical protein
MVIMKHDKSRNIFGGWFHVYAGPKLGRGVHAFCQSQVELDGIISASQYCMCGQTDAECALSWTLEASLWHQEHLLS